MASIQGVYIALFGRPADLGGLAFFNGVTNNGQDLTGIGPLNSQLEFTTRFQGQTSEQIVSAIYQSLFNRVPDPAGQAFFVAELAAGRQSLNTIAINILDGAQGTDLIILNNKLAAADAFTAEIDTATEFGNYRGTAAANSAAGFIQSISTTAPTQAQVKAALAAVFVGDQPPLGYGTNPVTGGDGDDVITVGTDGYIILAGGGNDTITFTAASPEASRLTAGKGADIVDLGTNGSAVMINIAAGDSGTTFTTADQYTNFITYNDLFNFGIAAANGANYVEGSVVAGAYAAALIAADALLAGSVRYALVDVTDADPGAAFAPGSILFVDRDGDGAADQSVFLAGVMRATFAATDIGGYG